MAMEVYYRVETKNLSAAASRDTGRFSNLPAPVPFSPPASEKSGRLERLIGFNFLLQLYGHGKVKRRARRDPPPPVPGDALLL
jgi:hypothetical protein